jgi:A/G-specific adenine glycosylase
MVKDKQPNVNQDLPALLLAWYQKNKRDLPFRDVCNPYHTWLSEIMLQQTTVATVMDYYPRFIVRFPTIQSVAQAKEADLLTLWQGLGYYARIRNFHKACQKLVRDFDGKMPRDRATLKTLPGIGDYTAAAIASIAFGKTHAVVDGNVKRVLARLFNYRQSIATREAKVFFDTTAKALLNKKNPGDHNQAMMELGATVCRPQPLCSSCPVSSFCAAQDKSPEQIPVKNKTQFVDRTYSCLIVTKKCDILFKKPVWSQATARRAPTGMWELPGDYVDHVQDAAGIWHDFLKERSQRSPHHLKAVGTIKHSITNKKITSHVFHIDVTDLTQLTGHRFISKNQVSLFPVSTLSRKALTLCFGK